MGGNSLEIRPETYQLFFVFQSDAIGGVHRSNCFYDFSSFHSFLQWFDLRLVNFFNSLNRHLNRTLSFSSCIFQSHQVRCPAGPPAEGFCIAKQSRISPCNYTVGRTSRSRLKKAAKKKSCAQKT